MRLIKRLGLAAIAAVAAMAFIASSAMASGSTEITPTSLHGIATHPLLDNTFEDIKCSSSLAKVGILALGTPQIAHIEELTWTGCKTHGGFSCTVTTVLLGLVNILRLSATDAHATSTGGTLVRLQCPFIDCVYGGTPTLLGLGADLPTTAGTLHVNTIVSKTDNPVHEGDICPAESIWLALYESLADVTIGT